eukprot:4864066-Amphidinium_carterae.2
MPWTGVSMYKMRQSAQKALLTCSTLNDTCLPGMSMIPSEGIGVRNAFVTLAIDQQQTFVWRALIFADGVKTTLMPIGPCCELLNMMFERAKRT